LTVLKILPLQRKLWHQILSIEKVLKLITSFWGNSLVLRAPNKIIQLLFSLRTLALATADFTRKVSTSAYVDFSVYAFRNNVVYQFNRFIARIVFFKTRLTSILLTSTSRARRLSLTPERAMSTSSEQSKQLKSSCPSSFLKRWLLIFLSTRS
jgi:hypothetical protein